MSIHSNRIYICNVGSIILCEITQRKSIKEIIRIGDEEKGVERKMI